MILFFGKENLVWASNRTPIHTTDTKKAVYEALNKAVNRETIVKILKELGDKLAKGKGLK